MFTFKPILFEIDNSSAIIFVSLLVFGFCFLFLKIFTNLEIEEINDLQNFLSIKISNLEIITESNETILKSNKINIKLSLLDLIEGLTNNQLLLENIFIPFKRFKNNSFTENVWFYK